VRFDRAGQAVEAQPGAGQHGEREEPLGVPLVATAGSMIVVVNRVLAGVVGGLLWRSVAGPSGPLPLALAATVGFLGSLVSQGIYGQRAFRRDLGASTVAFPAGPAGDQDH
jgi:hypothetical protein